MKLNGMGRIDRSQTLRFRFDGQSYDAAPGDTVASALMAQDISLVGRSFKYHRPRGFLTAGSEEPNALVTVGTGAARVPNTRATMQEIFDGLVVESQNRWPSLEWDALSVNNLAAPFLSAGFYYKTFMWPPKLWEKLYEPFIRRAAGLGALDGRHNPDRYERAFAFCDVLVIGGGPSGLMAAWQAAQAGADVILCEEGADFGGWLRYDTQEIDGQTGWDWTAQMVRTLHEMPNVRLMSRTTVTGAYDQGVYGALERVGLHRPATDGLPQECFWRITTRRAVLAAGAIERPVAFQNNDAPNILMASALRAYISHWGVAPGKAVLIFGNTDEVYRTAQAVQAAGLHLVAVVDHRTDGTPPAGLETRIIAGGSVIAAQGGRHGVQGATVRHADGRVERLQVDVIAMSGGWNPSVHLACHMNGRPVWDETIKAFVPKPGMIPGMTYAGAARGTFSTHGALSEGAQAGGQAASELGFKAPSPEIPQAVDAPYHIRALWAVPGKGRAWLDFQNDVTVKDVVQAAQENFRSVEHMKRYTTQGMATDQGKNSNVGALAVLADVTGRAIPETGTTTFRPPFVPVSIAAMGAGAQGAGFAPQRFTTSHAASVERNAPMIEAGLWYRPSYFPREGEKTWREACDREVTMVRETVGICDVSTLGKIDLQGPDVGAFLDFVYCNTFSTLKPGRVRYGLMLREDGHVMDDGTTARLSDQHYVMTTTTAAAGQVMRHLEFVHQAFCPDMDVRFTSLTEQWAQFAVAGPKSKDLLQAVLDTPLTDADWPFMACGEVRLGQIPARLFRISFSGEHAYELAVPARYGDSLFRLLVQRAEDVGGGAYGMEALNVLRIEKGFITHAEIHGRTTAYDIGMGRMVSAKKDCIGKALSQRPGLLDPARERLVGLRPVTSGDLTAGAHLFNPGDDTTRENDQGYVTSVCYSPTLGENRALAFLKHGPDRMGEQVRHVDHLRGIETLCEVVPPVAFDPEGGRLRG